MKNTPFVTKLCNGVEMPLLIQGLSLRAHANMSLPEFSQKMRNSLHLGIRAFDTAHDYGNSEDFIGKSLIEILSEGEYQRSDIFITSKIGNQQQLTGDIEEQVNQSLKALHVDYIDCMLLHWPVPGVYIFNWKKLEDVYKKGKVRSIGIANAAIRHLKELETEGMFPQVVQVESHPFGSKPQLYNFLQEKGTKIQAYGALCNMLPFVQENVVLKELSNKYECKLPALMIRWQIQRGVASLFRAYNPNHLKEILHCVDFELSPADMKTIDDININYKFHPESLNCPGW